MPGEELIYRRTIHGAPFPHPKVDDDEHVFDIPEGLYYHRVSVVTVPPTMGSGQAMINGPVMVEGNGKGTNGKLKVLWAHGPNGCVSYRVHIYGHATEEGHCQHLPSDFDHTNPNPSYRTIYLNNRGSIERIQNAMATREHLIVTFDRRLKEKVLERLPWPSSTFAMAVSPEVIIAIIASCAALSSVAIIMTGLAIISVAAVKNNYESEWEWNRDDKTLQLKLTPSESD